MQDTYNIHTQAQSRSNQYFVEKVGGDEPTEKHELLRNISDTGEPQEVPQVLL